jgi:hypothetical protein
MDHLLPQLIQTDGVGKGLLQGKSTIKNKGTVTQVHRTIYSCTTPRLDMMIQEIGVFYQKKAGM